MPVNRIIGTTIETNRIIPNISLAPIPEERKNAMKLITGRKFVTIEPVLDFCVDILADWIKDIKPTFINIGADSKNHGLPEPTMEKIMELVEKIKDTGIELIKKSNLQRLLPK